MTYAFIIQMNFAKLYRLINYPFCKKVAILKFKVKINELRLKKITKEGKRIKGKNMVNPTD